MATDESTDQRTTTNANMYNPRAIEQKWKERWESTNAYRTETFSDKPKYYCLVMFPYPSGSGLSVGHLRNYIPVDVMARFKKMQGHDVLHPMGWDAFGLPAENAAIKNNIPPKSWTYENINRMQKQLRSMGNMFAWKN